MVRAGSVNYAMDDGYVPDYHTGRRMSAQSEHVCLASSGRMFGQIYIPADPLISDAESTHVTFKCSSLKISITSVPSFPKLCNVHCCIFHLQCFCMALAIYVCFETAHFALW